MPSAPSSADTSRPRAGQTARQPAPAPAHHNDVHVIGRMAAVAEPRTLPSGDTLVTWRVVVERDGDPTPGRPHLDTLECVAWQQRLQRAVLRWQPGELVEVRGSLRRRFWRSGAAVSSRYEVEAREARRLAKAPPSR